MDIAIIGAGMAGFSCAQTLVAAGHKVTLFDKGRGPGGRMATRKTATGSGQASFDHGAQYFTVRDLDFASVVRDWSARGVAARWPEVGSDTWVGVPGMNAVIKDMAARHDVAFGFLAKALVRQERKWCIIGEKATQGEFDAVVLALPAEQAAPILSLHDFQMARTALLARSQPCWTAMFAFSARVPFARDVIKDAGPIAWASRNNAKPGRESMECWVVQANATWSTAQLENAPDLVEDLLKRALETAIGSSLPDFIYSTVHRWRYALSAGSDLGSLWNEDLGLGVCGDWLLGPRVECAWLSGRALGQKMAKALDAPAGVVDAAATEVVA